VLASLAISPILDHFEEKKFKALNNDSQKIHTAIKSVANADEVWNYKTGCGENYAGAWLDGTYQCVTISYMEKVVSSAEDVIQSHNRYFSEIDKHGVIITARELEFVNNDTFGQQFVVSSAGKQYINKKTGFLCNYESYLGQNDLSLNSYGTEIKYNKGILTITFRCSEKAGQSWYPKIKDVSGMIPDFTPNI
jgi:hypothetical protein